MKKSIILIKFFVPLLLLLFCFNSINAQTLKSIATSKNKFIGNIMSSDFINDYNTQNGNLNTIASTEYNVLVTENAMKMDAILRTRPANPFNVTVNDLYKVEIDRFLSYGGASLRKRGHTMIWNSQAPAWLTSEAPGWSAQQIYDFSYSYIIALATYTKGKIQEWDVLNEAINDDATPNYRTAWYSKVNTQANNSGQIGYLSYFGSLFSWARAADPTVKLFYNDYSIEQYGTSKNNFMRAMVKAMKSYNTPINGVGFQSHFALDNNGMGDGFINQIGQSIDDLGAAGFEVVLTELDIRRCDASPGTDAQQRSAYDRIIKMALGKTNCNSVLIWGLSDNNSWIPYFFTNCGNATLHNSSYQKKEAYFGVLSGLQALGGGLSIPIGKAIWLKGNNGRYVSSENGAPSGITCNRTAVGSWERFTVVNAGGGKIGLKGENGRYISSENGVEAMRCDRTYIGTYEAFDWIIVNSNTVQLKGNNSKFVCSENGAMPLTCNRVIADIWENFTWAENGAAFRSASTNTLQTASPAASDDFIIYPLTSKNFRVAVPVGTTALRVVDYSGRHIKTMQVNGKRMVDVNVNAAAGVYIMQAVNANKSVSKKIVVQ